MKQVLPIISLIKRLFRYCDKFGSSNFFFKNSKLSSEIIIGVIVGFGFFISGLLYYSNRGLTSPVPIVPLSWYNYNTIRYNYACFTFLISNSHSIKISETAKGVRIDVHIYATDKQTAINEAVATYLETRLKVEKEKIQVAPMDVISK
jgi:hypothetical protein